MNVKIDKCDIGFIAERKSYIPGLGNTNTFCRAVFNPRSELWVGMSDGCGSAEDAALADDLNRWGTTPPVDI